MVCIRERRNEHITFAPSPSFPGRHQEASMPKKCARCGIRLDVPCTNPVCDGHHNERRGDVCVYCATNERSTPGFSAAACFAACVQAYTILAMERSEAKTRWTAYRAAGDPSKLLAIAPLLALPAVSGPRRSCGVRRAVVALRCACPTSRRRRGTPSGSVTRFTPLPAAGVTGTDSRVGEMHDCQGTWSTVFRTVSHPQGVVG